MILVLLAAIQLTLSPHFGYAPLSVRVKLTIKPNYLNQSVCVEWEGPQEGGSCWQLEGQYAAQTHFHVIKELPEGWYAVRARLFQIRETITTATQPIQVFEGIPPSGRK